MSEPRAANVGLMALNSKAGMEGLDKDKVNAIISEASKGSKFYAKKCADQVRLDLQIAEMQGALAKLSVEELSTARVAADSLISSLRRERDTSRTIVHVDMDMFYAAVEMRDRPHLGEVPMAVGGMGMLCTSNYRARKYGVRAAMPGFIALKLCPSLVIVPTDMEKYAGVAKLVREVFTKYDPNFCPMSLDEAYLDITDLVSQTEGEEKERVESIVSRMREEIKDATGGLTASAGIACNTLLSKVCSDMNKPDGQYLLPPVEEDILTFVSKLPIRKVGGIGNVQEQLLKAIGVETCADIYTKRAEVKLLFSELSFQFYMQVSQGISATTVTAPEERERKSISQETTFRGTSDRAELLEILGELARGLASDMDEKGLLGTSLTLKVKTEDFQVKSKVCQLPELSCEESSLLPAARALLTQLLEALQGQPLRLMGLRMAELRHKDEVAGRARQTNIHSFFKEGQREETNPVYTCPVCQLHMKNLSALNKHIEACLPEDSQAPLTQAPIPQVENSNSSLKSPKESGEKGFFRKIMMVKADRKGTCIKTSPLKNSSKDPVTNSLLTLSNPEPESDSKPESSSETFCFLCPVCEIDQLDLQALNAHIDHCLERSDQCQSEEIENFPNNLGDVALDVKINVPRNCDDINPTQSEDLKLDSAIHCPVCGTTLNGSEIVISRHVDDCLSRKEVKAVISADNFGSKSTKRKSSDSNDINKTSKGKKLKLGKPPLTLDLFYSRAK